MTAIFGDLHRDVPVPKAAWQWVDSAQYRLLRAGAHRALSSVDLLVCAGAAIRGLVILHDDADSLPRHNNTCQMSPSAGSRSSLRDRVM
jgi:hypothetical protein